MIGRFKYYRNFKAYKKRHMVMDNFYEININTIRRCAIVVGTNPWLEEVPKEVLKWKLSLIEAYIDTLNGRLDIKNIGYLEKTEKAAVSFFIGMIFAQVIAQELFGIRQLYHLEKKGEERFIVTSTGKSPDLCGYCRRSGRAFLFEAKGATVPVKGDPEFFKNSIVKEGCIQLNSVSRVAFTHTGRTYWGRDLKKLVVATHPNSENQIINQIIDPINFRKKKIVIDSDLMAFKYYFNIISLIETHKSFIHSEAFGEFRVLNVMEYDFNIGLKEEIYQILRPYYLEYKQNVDVNLSGIYLKINQVLDIFENDKRKNLRNDKQENLRNISLGIDGVITFNNYTGGNHG